MILLQNGFKRNKNISHSELKTYADSENKPYYVLIVDQQLILGDIKAVYANSEAVERTCKILGVTYDGWSAVEN